MNSLAFLVLAFGLAVFDHHRVEASCNGNNNLFCIPIQKCKELKSVVSRLTRARTRQEKESVLRAIEDKKCGTLDRNLNVCCHLELDTLWHKVSGRVTFEGDDTIVITDFVYDGEGPDAFFVAGTSGGRPRLGSGSFALPYPQVEGVHDVRDNRIPILGEFPNNKDPNPIKLKIPKEVGVTVWDIRWLSVYCRDFKIDFGNAVFPKHSNLPKN